MKIVVMHIFVWMPTLHNVMQIKSNLNPIFVGGMTVSRCNVAHSLMYYIGILVFVS